MAVRLPLTAIAFVLWLSGVAPLHAVQVGASKNDVITELGRPTSQVARDHREILSYPKGVRIELVDGQVQSAEGIALTFSGEDSPKATTQVPAAAANEIPAETAGGEPKAAQSRQTQSNSQVAKSPNDPIAALDRFVQKTEAERNTSKRDIDELPIKELALLLAFHFVVTLIGLKLAFKFWTMDALASGVLMIALIDVILHGVFDALGPVSNGLTTMPAVENGIPGIVMIFSIRHFCFNKNIGDAIQTASVVKVAVALLKMFGAMAVLSRTFH